MRQKPELAARVIINGVPVPLSYAVPAELDSLRVGDEAVVELGRREARGWVIELLPLADAVAEHAQSHKKSESNQLGFFQSVEHRLKPILKIEPAFLPDQVTLFRWMAEYYGTNLAEVLETALPKRASSRSILIAEALPEFRKRLTEDSGLEESLRKSAPIQAKLLEELLTATEPVQIAELKHITRNPLGPLRALKEKGYISLKRVSQTALIGRENNSPFQNTDAKHLTAGQQKAFEAIVAASDENTFTPFLLHGVTGSGKTEVYLQSVQHVLSQGGSALVVLPEISLTPQFIDQFQSRLNAPIALLHSQVGYGARWQAWMSLMQGEVKVALGARSAVFAPLKNLKLVIVDEEHESSYKQSDGLRYHGRDVAVMRAKIAGCPVLLGSATPSFESLINAQRKRYKLLELPERVSNRVVPRPELIDLNKIRRSEMPSPNLSPLLHAEIEKTLAQKGQVVILYNKRGFSSYLQCESCNEVLSCPNCSVPLTFHRSKNSLLCHYCNLSQTPPESCPVCRDPATSRVDKDEEGKLLVSEKKLEAIGRLAHRGAGTEKVVEELQELFPDAAILRMDRDTVTTKGAYRDILGSMRSGEADILVGTQMIAKGHDLPGVTLVGIIDADVGLHIPDFRSSEKIFQLITQASGRAGRGEEPGRVLVQTRQPNHPTLVATVTGRFRAFARYELEFRKQLGYPPLGRLLRLVISSPYPHEAQHAAMRVRDAVRSGIQQLPEEQRPVLLGPATAPYERLKGRYRWHMLVKGKSPRVLSELARSLNRWKSGVKGFKDFRLSIDIDPVDML